MFVIPPYTIIDISDQNQQWSVVVEAKSRKAVTDYLEAHGLAECDVFKESGEELYRGLCKVSTAISK